MQARIEAIEYFLPACVLNNVQLAEHFTDWTAEKIENKTGIRERHIAAAGECSSDLGVAAAQKLFESGRVKREDVDYLLFCTQSPDYFLPTTACLVQHRLGIPTTAGALDFNLGCSGFVYGLSLAKGLIETGQARNVLLITAETYSKFIHPGDKSVRTLFGDAAAATLIQGIEADSQVPNEGIGPFVFGTDGRGANNLIVPAGGCRRAPVPNAADVPDEQGNVRTVNHLFMNGAEIFNFTLQAVPQSVQKLLAQAGKRMEDIDLYVFHQANGFILEHLRKKLRIPSERFLATMRDCGNTVSSTIPIALKMAEESGQLITGHRVMIVGFGVGYSWAASLLRWTGRALPSE